MNDIVIDASCILEFLLNQTSKEAVIQKVGESQLIAPSCLPFEIGNALSKLMKRKLISIFDGVAVFHEFVRIPLRLMEPDIPDALLIAGNTESYAYDSYYISLAKRLNMPLFTLNENMKSNAQSQGVTCL
ncbi:MAG: type II toxin-antitoxin system VapC family toxin [Treponema sp.]|nr:type II toxin-antitoxin system VapC family toxin [Treponema sp.]